jgi:hypothetical protein
MRLTSKIYIAIAGAVIGVPIGLLAAFYSIFLAIGVVNIAPDVLKSLVEANAALLGFLGIITVFVLSSYNDSARLTEEQIYRLELEHQKEMQNNKAIGYSNIASASNVAEPAHELYLKRKRKLGKRLKGLRKESGRVCYLCVGSATSFLASILLSLLGMGEIPALSKFVTIYCASVTCILGVFSIFILIFYLREQLGQ